MDSDAKNGFKVLLYLMNQAVDEDAACEVLKNFVNGCLKSALVERTEQCAKIVIEQESRTLPSGRTFLRTRCRACKCYWDDIDNGMETHKPDCAVIQIRALNTEGKS